MTPKQALSRAIENANLAERTNAYNEHANHRRELAKVWTRIALALVNIGDTD